ncbi:hypothetical protein BYT27DRAFT_7251650 [Phlegmacium glaucopus]|nr:hypothetical protein BYT27DRAFT_7251650 [Phlegmacium glaucopus]
MSSSNCTSKDCKLMTIPASNKTGPSLLDPSPCLSLGYFTDWREYLPVAMDSRGILDQVAGLFGWALVKIESIRMNRRFIIFLVQSVISAWLRRRWLSTPSDKTTSMVLPLGAVGYFPLDLPSLRCTYCSSIYTKSYPPPAMPGAQQYLPPQVALQIVQGRQRSNDEPRHLWLQVDVISGNAKREYSAETDIWEDFRHRVLAYLGGNGIQLNSHIRILAALVRDSHLKNEEEFGVAMNPETLQSPMMGLYNFFKRILFDSASYSTSADNAMFNCYRSV